MEETDIKELEQLLEEKERRLILKAKDKLLDLHAEEINEQLLNERYKEMLSKFKRKMNRDPDFAKKVIDSIIKVFPCWWCSSMGETSYTAGNGEERIVCWDCLRKVSSKDKIGLISKLMNKRRVPMVVHHHSGKVFMDIQTLDAWESDEQREQVEQVWRKLLEVTEDRE